MSRTTSPTPFAASLVLAGLLAGSSTAFAAGDDPVARGRYLVTIAGCNDCHTPGYMEKDGEVPESAWLTGDRLGWNGPWGTTYASNLRLFAQSLTEEQWVALARSLKARPPMPWFNLNRMTGEDARAVYQFLRALGPAGEPAPAYLPPGVTPPPPYATFPAPPS